MFFFEPTDRRKAAKALSGKYVINYASPNFLELQEMARVLNPTQSSKTSRDLTEIVQLSKTVSPYIHFLIITLGANGVITIKNKNSDIKYKNRIIVKMYPTDPLETIENVSGAGDSFSSGVLHGILSGLKESQCISIGFRAAKMTLKSKNTVSPNLSNINIMDFKEANYRYIK